MKAKGKTVLAATTVVARVALAPVDNVPAAPVEIAAVRPADRGPVAKDRAGRAVIAVVGRVARAPVVVGSVREDSARWVVDSIKDVPRKAGRRENVAMIARLVRRCSHASPSCGCR